MLDLIKKIILAAGGEELTGDKVGFGDSLLVLLICMLMIFLILVILMGLLYLIKYANRLLDVGKTAKKPAIETQAALLVKAEEDDDEAIVAAITAALYMQIGADKTENIAAPFVIKNIKRVK